MRKMFKMLAAMILILGLSVIPVSASEGALLNWGDEAYQIIVPGFIEVRDIVIEGETTPAVVMEKPAKKDNGRYDFFEVVTTDADAVMITSNIGTFEEAHGDLMAELEEGKVVFSPTLYDDLDEIAAEPLFFGFAFRNMESEAIYEFPLWIVFEEAGASETEAAEAEAVEEEVPETVETPDAVKEITAQSTLSKVMVDGEQVSFDAYNIEGSNYFKLRDLAMAINGTEKNFEVTWDGEKNAINLISGQAYTPVGNELVSSPENNIVKGISSQSAIYLDGEEVELEAYNINGNNYFKLRDVAKVFDFGVIWNGELNQIEIDTTAGYIE